MLANYVDQYCRILSNALMDAQCTTAQLHMPFSFHGSGMELACNGSPGVGKSLKAINDTLHLKRLP